MMKLMRRTERWMLAVVDRLTLESSWRQLLYVEPDDAANAMQLRMTCRAEDGRRERTVSNR